MESLRAYLDRDTSFIIFEFLINDGDYYPFTLKDIENLSGKIKDWYTCMMYASKIGNAELLMYASLQNNYNDLFWFISKAAENGHLHIIKIIEENIDCTEYWGEIVENAISKGHLEIAKYAEVRARGEMMSSYRTREHYGPDEWGYIVWDWCMFNAARSGNLEMINYVESKCKKHIYQDRRFFIEDEREELIKDEQSCGIFRCGLNTKQRK